MKEQTRILNNLIGKRLNAICFKSVEHSPLPNPNREYVTYKNEIAFLVQNQQPWEEQYILKGLMVDFETHSNIYKMKIEKVDILEKCETGGFRLDEKYSSIFNLNFLIGSIKLQEEVRYEINLSEIRYQEILPSSVVITDSTGIQSVLINCYETPGLQDEIEMRIRFHLGYIGSEDKVSLDSEMKYINLIGIPTKF